VCSCEIYPNTDAPKRRTTILEPLAAADSLDCDKYVKQTLAENSKALASVRRVLLGGGLENLFLVRSRANVPDKGTRGSLHSHNFKKVDESVTKSLDSWRTQSLISGAGLVGAFRLRRPHRCAVRILYCESRRQTCAPSAAFSEGCR
jgi:hypothetical protein